MFKITRSVIISFIDNRELNNPTQLSRGKQGYLGHGAIWDRVGAIWDTRTAVIPNYQKQ